MISTEILVDIIDKRLRGEKLTETEEHVLNAWLLEDLNNQTYFNDISQPGRLEELAKVTLNINVKRLQRKFEAKMKKG